MAAKNDKDNWLKYPEKLELLKTFPFWKISDEEKMKKKKL